MYKIPYDASRKSLYHPGEADNFFQFGFALTDEKVLCAEMSRLAYVKEIKRLEAYLERAEFELHWSLGYGKNGTQLFIAKTRPNSKCPPLVIVAFRGTEPDDPSDLLADAILLKKFWLDASGNPLGEVHTGFANALLDDAGNSDILTQLSAQLDDLANQFPRILLTGHSLGAALATLSAGYLSQTPLANNLHIYSFGSPRVGDSVFSERMAKVKHDRYVNYCDLVTCIPSESLGYQHVGTLHHINRHGSVEDSITEADITEGRLKASVAHLMKYCLHKGTVWVRQLSDHSPINYLSSVARYTNFDEVKIEEYPYIHALRKKTTVPKDEGNDKPENLVGIAFSGGGIRSATFGLGVLEALKEKDLLQNIDYLSTVSGGGYVGSWLSANCHRQGNSWIRKDDPEWKESWKESISQLRRNSNYLSPNLSLLSADTWSMGTIWLRNTLLLQLMIVMGIACLLLLPRILSPIILFPGIFPPIIQFGWDTLLYFATFMLSGYLIISIAGNLKSLKLKIEKEDFKDQDLTFLIKHIPPIESGQTKVQLLVIVSMLISLCVSAALWVQTGLHHQELSSFLACIEFITSRGWPLLLLTYAAFVLFSCCSGRNNLYHWLISIPASIVMCLLLATTVYLLSNWVSFTNIGSRLLAFAWAPPLVLFAFSLAIITLIGIQGRGSYESIREWWSRFAAWLAIYGFAWMLIVTIAFYGPLWSERLYYDGSWKTLGTGWIGTTLAGLLAGKSSATGGMESKGITTKLKEIVAKAAPFVFIAGLLIVVSLVLHLVIANFTPSDPPFEASRPALLGTPEEGNKELALQIEEKSNDQIDVVARETSTPAPSPEDKLNYSKHWELLADANYGAVWVVFGVCSLCVGLLGWRIDINVFSLNYFYRNRLSRCFLGASRKPVDRKPHPFTGFDDEDDLELSALLNNKIVPSGPLHIVNCALNLGGSSDLSLHTRHSAIFTFTPLRCGSSYKVKKQNGDIDYSIDYVQTLRYGPQGQPTLGQAISVSGAAASPNMGYHTSAPAAFLMTLFNTRLGWWFPNPSKSNCRMLSPTFSLNYLLQELFGLADEKSDFLAISDGGHFENLAAYELVKRRCKVIIISDGECDPKLQFEGLGTLIRMCEVDSDIGAKIDIDVRSIHPESESVWSRSRCAVGKIKYGKDENGKEIPDGWLIYIKASMNGQEDTTVMQYKATHPTFPHESTGDQFYGEDQFESYRSLGRDITAKLFGKVPIKNRSMDEIAKDLNTIFSPTLPNQAQFTQHADRLMEIWDKIGKNVSLTPLDKELCPLWDGNNPARSIFYLCSEMIQLMENVYMDLDLEDTWEHEDNKGWKELFQQWAKSSNLQATWEHTKSKYGERFQSFWKRNL